MEGQPVNGFPGIGWDGSAASFALPVHPSPPAGVGECTSRGTGPGHLSVTAKAHRDLPASVPVAVARRNVFVDSPWTKRHWTPLTVGTVRTPATRRISTVGSRPNATTV